MTINPLAGKSVTATNWAMNLIEQIEEHWQSGKTSRSL